MLRHPHLGHTVWADAICINQPNTQERDRQVSIMGCLYRRAHEVLAWLGEEADDSGKLFDYISSPGGESLDDHAAMLKRYISLFGKPDSLYFLSALAALFGREYWTRLWIVQEILLAQNITMYCGIYKRVDMRKLAWISWFPLTSMLPTKTSEQEQREVHDLRNIIDQSMFRRSDRHPSLDHHVGRRCF
jgi:hypothetical protein